MKAWGSSTHDIPDGMHRPLYASAMVFDNNEGIEFILLCLDHMFWRTHDEELEIRQSILDDLDIKKEDLILHLSHSHSTPSTAFEHIERPGGEYILPYRERIKKACKSAIHKARENKQLSTLTWAYGSCKLASDRDYSPPDEGRVLVGLNPEKKADDTILVGRVVDRDNEIIATLVNYACHPVSLGGANKLISADYVGAMRETVEISTNYAHCIFLHGASGELTPRRSYESDTVIADQNGKEVGYAALSV